MTEFKKTLFTFLVIFIGIISEKTFALCTDADGALLRKGPGKEFEVTWKVGKFMPLKKVESTSSWIKVIDLDGQNHWVHKNVIKESADCVVVKAETTALKQEPAKKPASTDVSADRYSPFKVIKTKGSWLQVEDDHGQKYWVAKAHVWNGR